MNQQQIYEFLETISQTSDPWHADTPKTRKSFELLVDLIKQVPHASILEVGSAQGYFTEMLLPLSSDITGIDISKTAVQEAKKRLPYVTFKTSTLEDYQSDKIYDVIVCSEVLYYIQDKQRMVKKLRELGRYLVTSNFIADFPQFCLGSIKVEMALSKYPVLKRVYERDIVRGELTLKTLRKLI